MIKDRNKFAEEHHNHIKELGYWDKPREFGTLLMLVVTEISKLFDENRNNKPEKLADAALRLYDICGYYYIDLSELPKVESCTMHDMISCLVNEIEAFRVMIGTQGKYMEECLSMLYLYAKNNNINLDEQMYKKKGILKDIVKRVI